MTSSKRKYQCFLILVQRSQCPVYIFKNLCVDCFRYKLSSVWSYIFFLNGPDKKPKQNSSKTKRHSRQQEAKSFCRRTAVSQQNFFWRCHSDFVTPVFICYPSAEKSCQTSNKGTVVTLFLPEKLFASVALEAA